MTLFQLAPARPDPEVLSIQGMLALDPVRPPARPDPADQPLAEVLPIGAPGLGDVEAWVRTWTQAAVEIVGGDRPVTQVLSWTTREVYEDLQRRAVLIARAAGQRPGGRRGVRPQVASVHTALVRPGVVEASARVRHGERSRALALRFERRRGRWLCTALQFA